MQRTPNRINTTGWLLAGATLMLALLCACPTAQAQPSQPASYTFGAHLHTVHLDGAALNDSTPGIYVQARTGLLAGASVGIYHNSHSDTSVYAAYTWEPPGRWAALTVGAVTGYRIAKVAPLLVPSVRLPIYGPAALRIAYLPKAVKDGAAGVHFSIEADL